MMEEKQTEDMRKVLGFAMDAGRILLSSGAEIFRVEETIEHICKYFNIDKVDTFVLSNGLFITAEKEEHELFAKVKHVPLSSIHLGIVTEVNDLSREICSGNISLDDAIIKLKVIEELPPKRNYFRVVAAGVGCGSFCYLLKGNLWESLIAFCIGMALFLFVIFAQKHKLTKIIVNIVGGALITVLGIAASHITFPEVVTMEKIIIGSILPLVPGVAFTNAIRDIANSDFISGTVRMIDAMLVFVYIALGVGFILSLYGKITGGFLI